MNASSKKLLKELDNASESPRSTVSALELRGGSKAKTLSVMVFMIFGTLILDGQTYADVVAENVQAR